MSSSRARVPASAARRLGRGAHAPMVRCRRRTRRSEDGRMGLLDGKTALIFGVANDHSIAWGIAKALHAEGAEVGFSSDREPDREARPTAGRLDRVDVRGALRRPVRRRHRAGVRALGRDPRVARHPGPRPCLRPSGRPGGHVRRHVARRLRARDGRLRVLAGRAHAGGRSVSARRIVGDRRCPTTVPRRSSRTTT